MRSIKTKLFSLGMAAAMLLALGGCAMSTPANVGSIGGVEIPAGVYLLAQYNSYNTASGLAKLATGETASDVKAVLKAECTGTINGEEVTTDGADYVSQLTTRAIEYYAAVEKEFDELGGTLDDAATAEAANSADSLWSSNGDLYTANGISKSTVETYLLNAQKAKTILNLTYGADGTTPVTEAEYTDYVNNECYYVETVQFPLVNYSSYSLATDDQKAQMLQLAQAAAASCSETQDGSVSEQVSALHSAASAALPDIYAVLDSTPAEDAASVQTELLTESDLTGSFTQDGAADAVRGLVYGEAAAVQYNAASIILMMRIDPLQVSTLDALRTQILSDMKGDELEDALTAYGSTLENDLSTSAMNKMPASKIVNPSSSSNS